jgi:ferrochelatase
MTLELVMTEHKTAVVLVNLGTPDAPTPAAVRRYLGEFLADPRVVEIPRPVWWLILHALILPLRSKKSAHAYQSIWSEQGSPLMVHTVDLGHALQEQLNRDTGSDALTVAIAMRYGRPSIRAQLEALRMQKVGRILIVPLYPQYAAATTASIFDAVCATLKTWRHIPDIQMISDYHADPSYLDAVARSIRQFWRSEERGSKLLLSFHGLPERSRTLGDPYYDQCQASARGIAERLELTADQWQVVFQSRFGPAEWLKPYCVDTLKELPSTGCTDVDIVCPGFAADCLETLEEIAITNRDVFLQAGGRRYRYIPALNSSPLHVSMLSALVSRALGVPESTE